MALSDLVIHPRTDALRYAMHKFDELRLIFQDLEQASFEPKKVKLIAKSARGRCISAKATMANAIEEAGRLKGKRPLPEPPSQDNRGGVAQ